MDSCNIYISYFSFPENSLYSIRKHLFEQEENFPLCGSTTISSGNMNFLFFCLLLVAFFGSLVGSFRIDVHIDDDKYLLEVDGGVDFEQAAMEFCRTKGLLDVSEVSTKNGCVAAIVNMLNLEQEKLENDRVSNDPLTHFAISPTTVFPYTVNTTSLEKSLKPEGNRLIVAAYLYGHDASLVSLCNGNVLGVIELERIFGERYFDLSLKADKSTPNSTSENDPAKQKFARDHLQIAVQELNKLTFSAPVGLCPSALLERNAYDEIILVDAQTRSFLSKALKETVPLINSADEDSSFHTVNHHYSHALLGWYDSPFYNGQHPMSGTTLILSYDGFGNDGSFMMYYNSTESEDGTAPLRALKLFRSIPLSLGQGYIGIANMIPHFWRTDEQGVRHSPCPYQVKPSCQMRLPGIFMAYASLGRPRSEWMEGVEVLFRTGRFDERNMPPIDQDEEEILIAVDERGERDFAATVQHVFENIVVKELSGAIAELNEQFRNHRGERVLPPVSSLVLVGGCALNVRVNTVVQNRFNFPVYVPSSPGDSGIAIGGGWHKHPPPVHPQLEYLGANLFDIEVLDTEVVAKYSPRRASPETVARLLVSGKVGAVVRGRQEVGPRALGHRSILAIPTDKEMNARMNRIKHREWYRPTAPVLNEEAVANIFENLKDTAIDSPYMSFAPLLQGWAIEAFPAIAHVDGTARPQTVKKSRNPWLWELLKYVGEAIGQPILINTSFNAHGHPIVNTVKDTIRLWEESKDLDFVVIEDWLFIK
jgi:carbamoyltransferase